MRLKFSESSKWEKDEWKFDQLKKMERKRRQTWDYSNYKIMVNINQWFFFSWYKLNLKKNTGYQIGY